MQDWQQRVIDEKTELDDKLNKLTTFINGPDIFKLDLENANLLTRQKFEMSCYSKTLKQRIELFK